MSETVINFPKHDKFYFNKGSELLLQGDVANAIRYLRKAVDLAQDKTTFLKCSYYVVLAQAYAKAKYYLLSNVYYFKTLESDIFAQVAFRGLGENYFDLGETGLSRFYLNQCINLLNNTQVALSAKEKLNEIGNKDKFRVVKSENGLNYLEEKKIGKFISQGKFNQVINLIEEKKNFSNLKVRAELALAYFFTNNTEKGIELINKFGDGSLTDKCNLLLMYYNNGDKKNYNKIKDELINFETNEDEQIFKIGLTFAQTEDYSKAKEFMQAFLSKNDDEPELKFLYAITCLNCGEKNCAKNILIDAKTIDPTNSYVFDYYLSLCQTENSLNKIQYIFNLPISEYLRAQNIFKGFLTLSQEDLLDAFIKNENLFYFFANNEETPLIKAIFLKLSMIENDNITKFFDYVLLNENLKEKTKNELVINRLSLNTSSYVAVVRSGVYTKIVVPNILATKSNNLSIYEALGLSIKFILTQVFVMNANLKRLVVKMERIIKDKKVNPFVLATYMCWDYLKERELKLNLSKVCKYFSVTQEEFYAFLDVFDLEV